MYTYPAGLLIIYPVLEWKSEWFGKTTFLQRFYFIFLTLHPEQSSWQLWRRAFVGLPDWGSTSTEHFSLFFFWRGVKQFEPLQIVIFTSLDICWLFKHSHKLQYANPPFISISSSVCQTVFTFCFVLSGKAFKGCVNFSSGPFDWLQSTLWFQKGLVPLCGYK